MDFCLNINVPNLHDYILEGRDDLNTIAKVKLVSMLSPVTLGEKGWPSEIYEPGTDHTGSQICIGYEIDGFEKGDSERLQSATTDGLGYALYKATEFMSERRMNNGLDGMSNTMAQYILMNKVLPYVRKNLAYVVTKTEHCYDMNIDTDNVLTCTISIPDDQMNTLIREGSNMMINDPLFMKFIEVPEFDREGFLDYMGETFGVDDYTRNMISNTVDYGIEHCNSEKDELVNFIKGIVPDLAFGEIARFCADDNLSQKGLAEKATYKELLDKSSDEASLDDENEL